MLLAVPFEKAFSQPTKKLIGCHPPRFSLQVNDASIGHAATEEAGAEGQKHHSTKRNRVSPKHLPSILGHADL